LRPDIWVLAIQHIENTKKQQRRKQITNDGNSRITEIMVLKKRIPRKHGTRKTKFNDMQLENYRNHGTGKNEIQENISLNFVF
jgi:hypothetical protein